MKPILNKEDLKGKKILFTTFHFGRERQYFFFDDNTFCMFRSFNEEIMIDEINSSTTSPSKFLKDQVITKEQYDLIIKQELLLVKL